MQRAPCSSRLLFVKAWVNYVLLGKFQTDCLEARFGQYRQLSDGKYNISLRQVFESEKKLRLLSTLKVKFKEKDLTLTNFELNRNQFGRVLNDSNEQPVLLCDDDFVKVEEYLPVITYIAGYVCFSINKR